ncbi:MAG TPA: MFS transporter [Jatrophihabitans sp.]|nr:MFS transporter [Jatrophihabitans sp.]
MTATVAPPQVQVASRATYGAFIGAGFAFASWASRIPQVRDGLHLDPSELGLVLLAVAAGSVIALPLAGPVVTRLGSRRTVAAMAVLLGIGLAGAALGYLVGVLPVVLGLFVLGFGNGAWDVAMNVQGALVERHLGYSIMPRYHAGFSVGTVGGALLGALMVALKVPVTAHLCGVAVVAAVLVPLAVRGFIADADEADPDPDVAEIGHFAAWTEPRTLLIGVFVLAFAFAEGTGNDWISVAVIDGYDTPAAVGTLAFAAFLTAMTAGRWAGPRLLDRYGRVPVIRALTLLALAGLALFVFGQWAPLAFAGALMWGVGVSLGFPVGMSAGADEPARAASRVSVIASIGYCAFLGGPPLVGFLGQRFTVLRGVLAVAVLLAVASLVVNSIRERGSATEA